jgi:hypothetical protein
MDHNVRLSTNDCGDMVKTKNMFGLAARISILFAAMVFSTHTCAVTSTSSPSGAVASGSYLSVSHTQERVESTNRPLDNAVAIPVLDGAAAHPAGSISKQLIESYVALGRHGQALAFELLLIGCYIALRIYSKRRKQSAESEHPAGSTATNSPVGVNK